MRRPSEKPSAAEISAHEEEVAKFLHHHLDPDDLVAVKALPISDRLCLCLGRAYFLMQVEARKGQIGGEDFLGLAAESVKLVEMINRQCAIENGSATA